MAIFHFTVKIVGRSKGKSIIAASAYINGEVMKNEETGKVSFVRGGEIHTVQDMPELRKILASVMKNEEKA